MIPPDDQDTLGKGEDVSRNRGGNGGTQPWCNLCGDVLAEKKQDAGSVVACTSGDNTRPRNGRVKREGEAKRVQSGRVRELL